LALFPVHNNTIQLNRDIQTPISTPIPAPAFAMSRSTVSRLARATAQSIRQRTLTTGPRFVSPRLSSCQAPRILSNPSIRSFSSTPITSKGLSPESENPQPTPKEPTAGAPKAANISAEQYEELSNEYMDSIVEKLEQLQEEKENVDVEYSVGPPHPFTEIC
jgi:frataxin